MTTTDTSTCSNLQGSTPIVTPSTPDPTGTFASNVNLGTGGSGIQSTGWQTAGFTFETPPDGCSAESWR